MQRPVWEQVGEGLMEGTVRSQGVFYNYDGTWGGLWGSAEGHRKLFSSGQQIAFFLDSTNQVPPSKLVRDY